MRGGFASSVVNMFLGGYAPPHRNFNRFHKNELLANLNQVQTINSEIDFSCATLMVKFDKNKSCLRIGLPSGIGSLKLRQRPQFA
jgi:hypothetical protein